MKQVIKISIIMYVLLSGLTFYGQVNASKISEVESKTQQNSAKNPYELRQMSGEDNIEHIDNNAGYSLIIPKWWQIRETPNATLFGGTFPAIEGIENALIFKTFEKSEYKNLNDFKKWVITNYKIGDNPKWSENHTILLKKNIDDFEALGSAYKIQLIWNGRMYDCCYVLIETSTAFLWVDFTATQETYNINFPKFKAIMSNYKTL